MNAALPASAALEAQISALRAAWGRDEGDRWQLVALAEADSTQRLAAEIARVTPGLHHRWLMLITADQRTGRGRSDKAFATAPGAAWTFTLGAELTLPAERWPLASLVVGEALARALSAATGADVRIKWPNDLVIVREGAWRKLGGCLSERVERQGLSPVWLCGIGINLRREGLPAGLREAVACLDDLGVDTANGSPSLLVAVVAAVRRAVEAWQADGGALDVARIDARLAFLGAPVTLLLDDGGERCEGRLLGVAADGRLRLGEGSGQERDVLPLCIEGAGGTVPWHAPPPLARHS